MFDTSWEAVTKVTELAIHPSKPIVEVSVRIVTKSGVHALHPISSRCQDVDNKLLMFLLPPSHLSM